MNLNELLRGKASDPECVLVLRHRPNEPALNKVLPWLAAKRPEVFNAYQQTQGERVERAMQSLKAIGYVASFLLQQRDPRNFRFTILELVSPTKNANDVIQLESSWKKRLHTLAPNGLNNN